MAEEWAIDRQLIVHLAKVARLDLTEEELELFTGQLGVILEAFREIDAVDTDGVEPSFHPLDLKNVFREDEARPWAWDPLGNAGHVEGKHFKGPRIT